MVHPHVVGAARTNGHDPSDYAGLVRIPWTANLPWHQSNGHMHTTPWPLALALQGLPVEEDGEPPLNSPLFVHGTFYDLVCTNLQESCLSRHSRGWVPLFAPPPSPLQEVQEVPQAPVVM